MSKLGYKPGDKLTVKYLGTDERGRHRVSRKAIIPLPGGKVSLPTIKFYLLYVEFLYSLTLAPYAGHPSRIAIYGLFYHTVQIC